MDPQYTIIKQRYLLIYSTNEDEQSFNAKPIYKFLNVTVKR